MADKNSAVAAAQAAVQALPQGVDGAGWSAFHDALVNLDNEVTAWANSGDDGAKGAVDMTSDLVAKAGNLAGEANNGSLNAAASGAEIATVLNAARMLPNYLGSL